jgi:hypothetical protein
VVVLKPPGGQGSIVMTEEIVKFDPSKLVDQVKDRIRSTFADLIPEEEWVKLVQREIDDFIKPTITTHNSYGHTTTTRGGLGMLVQGELSAMLKNLIKTEMGKPDWNDWWNGRTMSIGPELKKLLVESAPQILADAFAQMVVISLNTNSR